MICWRKVIGELQHDVEMTCIITEKFRYQNSRANTSDPDCPCKISLVLIETPLTFVVLLVRSSSVVIFNWRQTSFSFSIDCSYNKASIDSCSCSIIAPKFHQTNSIQLLKSILNVPTCDTSTPHCIFGWNVTHQYHICFGPNRRWVRELFDRLRIAKICYQMVALVSSENRR